MNGITFTKDSILAMAASTDPRNRVILITEHAPANLSQNPNIVKLPCMLPPFDVVANYIDFGEDSFKETYIHYLTSIDTIMNIYLIGSALFNKNIFIYTTEEEWSKDSIPFMDVLISVFVNCLALEMTANTPNLVSFVQTQFTISYAVIKLFEYGYISEPSFVKYMAAIPFDQQTINTYMMNKGITLDTEVDYELQRKEFFNILRVKAEDPSMTPALMGD